MTHSTSLANSLLAVSLLTSICSLPVCAQQKAAVTPDMDTARLAQISPRLQQLVDTKQAAGVVYLIAHHGRVVAQDAVGYADLENRKPMKQDTIFQIMSMTKNFTGVAAMMLVEEGRLELRRPIEDYLPEFKDILVEEKLPDGTIVTHKPSSAPKVWQLMDHTSGMASDQEGEHWDLVRKLNLSLKDAVLNSAKMHLTSDPGTQWKYSNIGIATLGRIIEVVSGQPYEQFVKSRILDPLAMKDTFFFPSEDKKGRIAFVYKHVDGNLVRSGADTIGGDSTLYRAGAIYPGPEFALYSTTGDLLHFYQMLLNGGTYDGHRYLSMRSLETMRTIFDGDLQPSGAFGGTGYGLTFEVMRDPVGSVLLESPGCFGHGGAFGTEGWMDPHSDLIMISLVQLSDRTGSNVRAVVLPMAEASVLDLPVH